MTERSIAEQSLIDWVRSAYKIRAKSFSAAGFRKLWKGRTGDLIGWPPFGIHEEREIKEITGLASLEAWSAWANSHTKLRELERDEGGAESNATSIAFRTLNNLLLRYQDPDEEVLAERVRGICDGLAVGYQEFEFGCLIEHLTLDPNLARLRRASEEPSFVSGPGTRISINPSDVWLEPRWRRAEAPEHEKARNSAYVWGVFRRPLQDWKESTSRTEYWLVQRALLAVQLASPAQISVGAPYRIPRIGPEPDVQYLSPPPEQNHPRERPASCDRRMLERTRLIGEALAASSSASSVCAPDSEDRLEHCLRSVTRALALDRDRSWDDRIVDCSVVLESILGVGEATEITYRVAMRAAVCLTRDPKISRLLFESVKAAYNLRSTIVHGSVERRDKAALRLAKIASQPEPPPTKPEIVRVCATAVAARLAALSVLLVLSARAAHRPFTDGFAEVLDGAAFDPEARESITEFLAGFGTLSLDPYCEFFRE